VNQADVRVMLSVHHCFLAFKMAANITDLLPQPLAYCSFKQSQGIT